MKKAECLRSRVSSHFSVLNLALHCLVALSICVSTSVYVRAQEAVEVIKVDVSLVTVNVAVKDSKGRPLTGLRSQDFLITDDDAPVSPEYFESEGPASIVFVVDTSSSMNGAKWKSLKHGLKGFLQKSRLDNDYTLIAFHSSAHIVAESVSGPELCKSLSELKPSGETALYDAVILGLDVLKRTRQRNRALVLITDGEDNSSRAKLREVERDAFSRRAMIYSVGVLLNDYCSRGIKEACNGKETVDQLAAITGGVAFFPDDSELTNTLKAISNEVNNQYSLSYYPPTKNAGWRTVRVAVSQTERRPKLRYQHRYWMN